MCKVKQANWACRIWWWGGGEYVGLLESDARLNKGTGGIIFVGLDRCQREAKREGPLFSFGETLLNKRLINYVLCMTGP